MKGVNDYFKQYFSQIKLPKITFLQSVFKKIDPSLATSFELIPTSEEIVAAMKACDPSKAHGYDAFNMKFIKEFWHLIANDIIGFFKSFFETGNFPTSINTTWITLIPKTQILFLLISLGQLVYWLFVQNYFKSSCKKAQTCTSKTQIGLVHQRNIHDGIVTANEALSQLKKKRIPRALLKLDFSKAYDSIRWRFLEHMLLQVCFGNWFIG